MSRYDYYLKQRSKKINSKRFEDLPHELRGPAHNKYGGHNNRYLAGYRGNTFGPASPCRQFSPKEIAEYEAKMREEGRLK